MKKTFLKKIASLLEKEVCHNDSSKAEHKYTITPFQPMQLEKFKSTPLQNPMKTPKAKETILSEGVHVKGELSFDKQLRIQGSFEGSLQADGKVIIDPKGVVKGDIFVEEAEVFGTVIGNISVKKLVIGSDAKITGDVKAELLTIHQGASFSGYLEIQKTFASQQAPHSDKNLDSQIHCLG